MVFWISCLLNCKGSFTSDLLSALTNALTIHRKGNFIFSAELKCRRDCIFAQHDASQHAVMQRVKFNVILWHFSKVLKQEKKHTLFQTCCPPLVWMGPKTLYNHLQPNHVPSTLFHFKRLYRMPAVAGITSVPFFRAGGWLSFNSNRCSLLAAWLLLQAAPSATLLYHRET